MSTESISTKLIKAYGQAFLFMLTAFVNSIIGMIVSMIGFFQIIGAFKVDNTTIPPTLEVNSGALTTGSIIAALGMVILVIGFYAALLYTAKKGGKNPLGYFESWSVTVKLILELAIAVIFGIILIIVGGNLGDLGGLFIFAGTIVVILFPMSALFYVLNYLQS